MTDPMDEFDAAQERLREIVDQARANTARAKRCDDRAGAKCGSTALCRVGWGTVWC